MEILKEGKIVSKIFYSEDRDENIKNILYHGSFKNYSAPTYAIMHENQIVCFVGSDIVDADNVKGYLSRKYPEYEFYISNEAISFE